MLGWAGLGWTGLGWAGLVLCMYLCRPALCIFLQLPHCASTHTSPGLTMFAGAGVAHLQCVHTDQQPAQSWAQVTVEPRLCEQADHHWKLPKVHGHQVTTLSLPAHLCCRNNKNMIACCLCCALTPCQTALQLSMVLTCLDEWCQFMYDSCAHCYVCV